MKKQAFQLMARVNKAVLPSMWSKDLRRLSKAQLVLVAWRIWVTKNALD